MPGMKYRFGHFSFISDDFMQILFRPLMAPKKLHHFKAILIIIPILENGSKYHKYAQCLPNMSTSWVYRQ